MAERRADRDHQGAASEPRQLRGAEPPVSVARQPDGKFVTTGFVRGVIVPTIHVSRFNANFTLDTSFSGDGTAPFPPGGVLGLRPTAVAVQDDGKIVSVATSTSEPATIVVGRLTATGQVDTSLGGSGSLALADPAALDERAGGVAADADTIYVGGDARLRDGRQGFVLYRLSKADGSLVSRTFSGGHGARWRHAARHRPRAAR